MKLDLNIDHDRNKFQSYSDSLLKRRNKVELKKVNPKRTLSQNSYFHVAFGILGDHLGFTIQEIKPIIKRKFGRFMIYEKKGHKFMRSTSDLDTKEMTEFLDWYRQYSNDEHGCYIMTPDDFYLNRFNIEKELQHIL